MNHTSNSFRSLSSQHAALRHLLELVPGSRPAPAAGTPLERLSGDAEPPLLIDAEVVEDATLRSRGVAGAPQPGFAAFLDGAQESRVLAWKNAVPIVYGVVSAGIRERIARRLVCWRNPIIERRIYAPLSLLPGDPLHAAFPPGELIDTASPGSDGVCPPAHPLILLERAKVAVSRDREQAERRLIERWCQHEVRPVLVDGGIARSATAAASEVVVGAVKSHRTLYATGSALDVVVALRAGERSSVLRLRSGSGTTVLAWYLRLREPAGHDALWGLVRLEMSDSAPITERADEVSRWMLAERAPLALPDARWDTMTYGVRSVEEMLRAVAK